jgi:hypothetical protein
MKKQILIVVIPIILAYLSILGLYVAFQRHSIFYPVGLTGETPSDYKLTPGKEWKEVSFTSADGVNLTGWWITHQSPVKRPVLLYCHGNADCLSQLAEVSKIFYESGFDALLFDYRSYGGSQKAPLSEEAVDADALAAYQWLKARGIPEGRIILWGHSLGSSVAARLATQAHPAGLILEGAFPSIQAVGRHRTPWLLVPSFLLWDKFETGKYVAERTCPLLEIHAEKDNVIPMVLGQKVYEQAAEPKQWLLIKGINHNDFPSVAGQYKDVLSQFTQGCLEGKLIPKGHPSTNHQTP